MNALPPMDVAGRLARLRPLLGDAVGADGGALITNLKNIRYLTGFTGSAGILLVLPDATLLVTDGRYGTQSAEQLAASGVEATIEIGQLAAQQDALGAAARGLGKMALEAGTIAWSRQIDFAGEWFGSVELLPTRALVEGLRMTKDEGEVARIEAAAAIADRALAHLRPLLGVGDMTEADVAIELDFAMRRGGATGSSFETIVATGPNAAKPHHRPGERTIGAGDLVVLDFGAMVDGYCSDMTRTVCVGEPTDEQQRMVDVVAASQQAGVDAVRAGSLAAAVDAACRQVIGDAGWADAFVHGTGHGVGLDIHEAPAVAATSTATLAAGHVITVEPGVYLPGLGGVRIEDTVVVTDDGCRCLTNSPKDLSV